MAFEERKLRIITAIADHGSFGRAATAVNLSQPALTRIIKDMERRLGQQLFERHSKGVDFTDAGQILLKYARQLLFDIDQAQQELEELKGVKTGRIRIGAVAAVTRTVLPKALAKLQQLAPGLTFEILEAPDGELVEAMLDRKIDLMVASDLIDADGILALDSFAYDDSFHVCCRTASPPVDPKNASTQEIMQQHWVMLSQQHTPRQLFDKLIKQAKLPEAKVTVETNTLGVQINMLCNSRLLGWLPHAVIANHIEAGDLCIIDMPALELKRKFRVFRRENGYFSKHLELLVSCLFESVSIQNE